MIEKIEWNGVPTKKKENEISKKLYFEVFHFLVKWEFLFKKIKEKLVKSINYNKFKKITFYITKTELKETYQMLKLLLKKNRTKEEQKFIEEQFKDIWRVGIIWTVWVLPWWMIIAVILQKLWFKYTVSAYDEVIKKEKK